MNATQAIAALKRLYGSKAAWRRNESALIGEARQAELDKVPALIEARDAARAARDARRAELLADPEYVRLVAAAAEAAKAADRASSHHHSRRVSVGHITSGAGLDFFHVTGEGDNWQEAIDAAKAKAVKS